MISIMFHSACTCLHILQSLKPAVASTHVISSDLMAVNHESKEDPHKYRMDRGRRGIFIIINNKIFQSKEIKCISFFMFMVDL